MAYTSETATSADIEREIEVDRQRIEQRIDAIQQRMSPGQIVDEVLTYAKTSGGGEYVANLGNALKNNPVPMALMGISLVWLMAGQKSASGRPHDPHDYPLATIDGSLRRTGPIRSEGASRYSDFVDNAGKRFKALTDETGWRAGHFMDEGGRTYRGFADASGRQIDDIRDEAGKLFDDASGWVSKTWRKVTETAGQVRDQTAGAGRSSLDMGSQLNDSILKHFQGQPLIGGALAFAVGAAIGAALPNTRQEDEAVGAAADDVKSRISSEAAKTVDKAESLASVVYDKALSVAADVEGVARDRIVEEAQNLQNRGSDRQSSTDRAH